MRLFETKKLFYNKYVSKVTFHNDLGHCFRRELQNPNTFSHVRKILDHLNEQERNGVRQLTIPKFRSVSNVRYRDYQIAEKLYHILKKFHGEFKIAITFSYYIHIYSNNDDLISELCSLPISELHRPNEDCIQKLKPNTILVDNPPKLPLKVILGTSTVSPTVVDWCSNNPDKCRIGERAQDILRKEEHQSGIYFYVRDEKVLNLISMLCGNNIRAVHTLVYKGS